MDFKTFFDTQLNKQQRAAVTHENGPLLVIAGAGSGKTRIITARIAHLLLHRGVGPAHIIALTFTNKAAQEMRERVQTFVETSAGISSLPLGMPFLGTFHAYCLRLLKQHGALIGLDSFGILDEVDQLTLMKKLLTAAHDKRFTPQQALAHISRFKNSMLDQDTIDYTLRDIYHHYEREKSLSKCLDFDDLLLYTIKLFQQKKFKEDFRNLVRHVLVDEYQDTNVVQHELLKYMAIEKSACILDSLCIVGDEDQAIYSWRGATVDNIVQFSAQVRDTTLITIEQNYRSAQPILAAANAVIQHNQARHPKKLWSKKTGNNNVIKIQCTSDYQEADLIARAIRIAYERTPHQTIAVLYRTHFQSRVLEEALLRRSIVYRIIGGIQFYERKEIKDLLAYMRLVVNPYDRFAFERAINCPLRGLGDKFLEQFFDTWSQHPWSTHSDIIEQLLPTLKPQQSENLKRFVSVFDDINDQSSAEDALKTIIERTGYLDYLRDTCDATQARERCENVRELVNAAHYFAGRQLGTVTLFLQEVALLQEKPIEQKQSPVFLMTIHAAKGLEFDTVCVTGLEEGLFPSARSLDNQANIEEERRLLYVAMTRAKNKLLLSWAENRFIFGSPVYQQVSRFLQELPPQVWTERMDRHNEYTVHGILRQFFDLETGASIQAFGAMRPAKLDRRHDGELPQHEVRTCMDATESPQKRRGKNDSKKTQKAIGGFKPHQPVQHATFGIGVVEHIEQRGELTMLTIKFKHATKKISSAFVVAI
jgi:DNA helicase-2/ATP-dependent DNA helicase PcrA